jgi:hypothetical protein
LHKQPITKEEEEIFINFVFFYYELDKKLDSLDYSTFTELDFENFKNYILYAFNFNALITNKLKVFQTYRLVVNEWVTGSNNRIQYIDFLKYPPLQTVNKANKYNRANTPDFNIFYSTENIDSALKEIRPPINKLITIGVWKPKSDKKLNSFPISQSELAFGINEGVTKATKALDDLDNYNSPLFVDYIKYYFKMLGKEFTKKINHHYEYYISSLFSQKILEVDDNSIPDFIYDCIIYPSVGNEYVTDNLAIRPSVIDNDFYLEKVIEFEIEEAFYDNKFERSHPESISLAKIKNVFETNRFGTKGEILW